MIRESVIGMESLYLGINTVFPLLVYMCTGIAVKRAGIVSDSTIRQMNAMIFKVLIALSLFNDIRKAVFSEVDKPWVFAYVAVAILLEFFIAWYIVSAMVKDSRDASVIIQGIYRSNHVLFGSMIAAALCTATGRIISASMIAMVVPLYNVLAVSLFEIKRGGRVQPLPLMASILKNPLIIAAIAALTISFLGIGLPEIVLLPVERMAAAASPMAIIMLGAMLTANGVRNHWLQISVVTLIRLVFVPVVVIGTGVVLGLRGDYLVILLAIFASPVAASSAAMAQTMDANGDLAAELVAMTTAVSIITIFLFVFTLSGMGLI